jgi:hypothetical protein
MPAHPTRWCGASDLTNTRQRRGEGDDSPFTGMALGEGGGVDGMGEKGDINRKRPDMEKKRTA